MMSDSHVLKLLIDRRDAIRGWIDGAASKALAAQAHLDEGTPERAYWNHGYQAALDDVIQVLSSSRGDCSADTSRH